MRIGKAAEPVLKRSVIKPIITYGDSAGNQVQIGRDAAVTPLPGTMAAAATNSLMLEGSRILPNGIFRCVNNVAAAGAKPVGMLADILVPPQLQEPQLKELATQLAQAAAGLSLDYLGGNTQVTDAVVRPVVTVTVLGAVNPGVRCDASFLAPGMELVVTKWVGLEGTVLLYDRYRERLEQRFSAAFLRQVQELAQYLPIAAEAATAIKSGVRAMHDLSEGGILGALWEMAECSGVGLEIDFKKIPIRQETIEVCELVGCNPYELLSSGSVLMGTEDGAGLTAALAADGIPSVVIGRTTDGNDRILYNEEEIRYLDRPKQDEWYRLTGESNHN
jgi:hydrogenase maturation factor